MFRKIIYYLLLPFLILICFSTINILVAQQIKMGPPIIEFATTPGSQKSFYVNILNQSDIDVQCSIFIKSMILTKQGMPVPVDSSTRSAAKWLSVQGDELFVLKAKENKKIRCSFFPSFRAKPGGYYGMIVCRTIAPQKIVGRSKNFSTNVNLQFQFSSVVMAIIKGPNLQAHINPEAPIIFGGNRTGKPEQRKWHIEIPVKNDGNIHVVLAGQVRLLSEAGHEIERMDLVAGRGYLLPEQRRTFKGIGKGPLPDGTYIAQVNIGQVEIKKFASERIPFYILNGQVFPGSPNKSDLATLSTTSQGFMLNHSFLENECIAGGKQFKAIKITNITNEPLHIASQVVKWSHDKNGNISFSENLDNIRSLEKNISISPDSFTIAKNRSKNIKLVISLPANSSGEYFDAIRFNRVGVPIPKSVDLLLSQSVLLATKAKTTEKLSAQFIDLKTQKTPSQGLLFSLHLKNTGNTMIYPHGYISIFDSKNQRVDDPLNFGGDVYILPANERIMEIEFKRFLPAGKYRLELVCEYSQTAKAIQETLEIAVK
ncbi:MAG: hypothetical protein DWQ05_16305 [Calditrichaeota bacterium]|nr:MAG: hypothetical protein DWQ05_16305 [Calditrichota bacterium]